MPKGENGASYTVPAAERKKEMLSIYRAGVLMRRTGSPLVVLEPSWTPYSLFTGWGGGIDVTVFTRVPGVPLRKD